MMETSMITGNYETAGAILPLNRQFHQDRSQLLKPFEDNLDHLKSLELEATLMLAVTYLRRNGATAEDDEKYEPSFPEICRNKNQAETEDILKNVAAENRRREEITIRLGSPLAFLELCREWALDEFGRKAILLLLMHNAAPDFMATFKDCDFDGRRGGMQISTLLAIICDNLRDQLACRKYFSVESTLIRNDLIIINGDVDDSSNILDEHVHIHERLVRFILGDNNLYSSCFRWIKREKSTVNLDQVILPGSAEQELVDCMEQYLAAKENKQQDCIEEFYGYGTALTYLFYGPSGTGKTMMAQALAAKFNRTIFSLSADDMREMPGSYQDIISILFREAALQNGIVFFDECDDVFEKGSRASRSLLIELEKARCVVILATNRPVELDPALERRISMKTYFPIPEADIRHRIWQALIPPHVTLAADVNLGEFAERYHFTGGLIRNTIFLALTTAGVANGKPTEINAALLHFAAGKQTATLADERKICTIEFPEYGLESLALEQSQRKRLKNMSTVWERLKQRKAGIAFVLTASDVVAAVRTAKAVAKECGLIVRSFDFQQVLSRSQDDRITDPVTQRMVTPMDYAFSPAAGDQAMTLFIDHDNVLGSMLAMKKENLGDIIMKELLAKLRHHSGMFCLVGSDTGEYSLPPEISLHERLHVPDRVEQERHWLSSLHELHPSEKSELTRLIDNYPLHLSEIDFVVRQASTLAIIRRLDERPNMEDIHDVAEKFRGKVTVPLLFGGEI